VRRISDLPDDEAAAELRACCASARWVERMLSQRPFKDENEVFESAERIWWDLAPDDWHEAFRAHPRIGEQPGHRGTGAPGHGTQGDAWSRGEQAGVAEAGDDVKTKLAQVNRDYDAKFGWTYLVCASGKSAEEMLAIAEARMHNDPDTELKAAAAEQAKITRLRLIMLLEKGT
jgi:2-oxo-4-hydroxy-4-carboxy-5-ureidoimidazoline decarboxylase